MASVVPVAKGTGEKLQCIGYTQLSLPGASSEGNVGPGATGGSEYVKEGTTTGWATILA
jgi:hypothetical protein